MLQLNLTLNQYHLFVGSLEGLDFAQFINWQIHISESGSLSNSQINLLAQLLKKTANRHDSLLLASDLEIAFSPADLNELAENGYIFLFDDIILLSDIKSPHLVFNQMKIEDENRQFDPAPPSEKMEERSEIDGKNQDYKERKKLLRMEKNRVSAQCSRQSVKAHRKELEDKIIELEKINDELTKEELILKTENRILKENRDAMLEIVQSFYNSSYLTLFSQPGNNNQQTDQANWLAQLLNNG